MPHDLNGRPWAKLSQQCYGKLLQADRDFSCLAAGEICLVMDENGRPYVNCDCGTHFLDSQLDYDDGETIVGFYQA